MKRSIQQRGRLVRLAARVLTQREPLGVGLHNGCWGAVAADIARANHSTVTGYFGISMCEFKDTIKDNNRTRRSKRNAAMALRTLRKALT